MEDNSEMEEKGTHNDKYGSFGRIPSTEADSGSNTPPENASKAFESLLHQVGNYSRYQWKLTFICGFCGLFTAPQNMSAIFLAATPNHWCEIPYFSERNLSLEERLLNVSLPWVRGKEGFLEHSKCTYYNYNYTSLLAQDYLPVNISSADLSTIVEFSSADVKKCDSWIYDDKVYKSTAVTEWDLVCDKRWVMSSIQASLMMGILVGAVIFSAVSDRMGRRVSSLFCCFVFFGTSVGIAFAQSLELFLALRFIVAATGQGIYLVNYILLMEVVSERGRNVSGNLFQLFAAIGFTSLILVAYAVTGWRNLQLVISVPSGLLLLNYWLLPESPRWLMMQGREEEGLKIMKAMAKANGRPFPADQDLNPILTVIRNEIGVKENKSISEKIKSVLDLVVVLVRTPNMRKRNLITFYIWFVASMVYYGLSFSGSNFKASPYAAAGFSAFAETCALPATILLLLRFGRRTVTSLSFLISGISCMVIMFIPTDMTGLIISLVTFGKFNISASFFLAFMLSAELVPTHVRNMSIGIASMWARIGSGIAPFIVDLLGDVYYAIPSTIFGALSIIAGVLALLLPETGKRRLPESIEEIEAMPR